jgi:predicted Zn-dependent protease
VARLVLLSVVLLPWNDPACGQPLGQLSQKDELQLGREAARQVERKYPVLRDRQAQQEVDRLGQRLARHARRNIRYHFRILDLPEVNAFALPGGYIYINRGTLELAQNDSEVAGVLAHEIAHIANRHSVEQIQSARTWGLGLGILDMVLGGRGTGAAIANLGAQMAGQGVFLKHSRDAEREADLEAVFMMRRAGINPSGMLMFLRRMAQIERSNPNRVATFFSTHPSLRERERNVGDLINGYSPQRRNRRPDSLSRKSVSVQLPLTRLVQNAHPGADGQLPTWILEREVNIPNRFRSHTTTAMTTTAFRILLMDPCIGM